MILPTLTVLLKKKTPLNTKKHTLLLFAIVVLISKKA